MQNPLSLLSPGFSSGKRRSRTLHALSWESLLFLILGYVASAATSSTAQEPLWIGSEATRTRVRIVDVDGPTKKVVLDSAHRFAAPEWAVDGESFVVNGGGKLWRAPAKGGELVL